MLPKFARPALAALIAAALVSCSSAPPRPKTQEAPKPKEVVQVPVVPATPEEHLTQARQEQGAAMLQSLLNVAHAINTGNCGKTLAIVAEIRPRLQGASQLQQASLLQAECYLAGQQFNAAGQLLSQLPQQVPFRQRSAWVSAQIRQRNKHWLQAATDWLEAAPEDSTTPEKIWQLLQHLDIRELERARLKASPLQSYLQLLLLARTLGDNPGSLATAINGWKQRFPEHPFVQQLPMGLQQALATQPYSPKRIAVLLPLSGRLASQGNAIQDGILAAYFGQNTQEVQLQFIDSNRGFSAASLAQDYDFIVGPLLKDNISQLIAELPQGVPALALNRVNNPNAQQQEVYYYSLAPEDEAVQLAQHLKKQGYKYPILIGADNNSAGRMLQAFTDEWLLDQSTQPPIVRFDTNKSMRTGVAAALDVSQSKKRIKEVKRLIVPEVHAIERNRRDVDAIVLFANAGQTALLNPMIEASISPFADILPVFASSRSYTQNTTKNSQRDLRNLTFIDMPWLLPKSPNLGLKRQTQTLFPERRDQDSRLFAMGYDAFNLIPKLSHLRILAHNRYQGLTGKLSMDEKNQIHRQLAWAQVQKDNLVKLD